MKYAISVIILSLFAFLTVAPVRLLANTGSVYNKDADHATVATRGQGVHRIKLERGETASLPDGTTSMMAILTRRDKMNKETTCIITSKPVRPTSHVTILWQNAGCHFSIR